MQVLNVTCCYMPSTCAEHCFEVWNGSALGRVLHVCAPFVHHCVPAADACSSSWNVGACTRPCAVYVTGQLWLIGTLLVLLAVPGTFELLAYTNADEAVPEDWWVLLCCAWCTVAAHQR